MSPEGKNDGPTMSEMPDAHSEEIVLKSGTVETVNQSETHGSATPREELFSIFTRREKWILIGMTGFAGFFSPMSANIYFPAIPLLAQDFGVSLSLMNLTVTVYLIFQGISPMFWAPLADSYGRRPVYLGCLGLLAITCVALALVPTDRWYLLLVFRCLQASGSASTVAVGSGVVADLAVPAERGGFLGLSQLGPLIGPCIGPVLGGILAGSLGWRWIFWLLCILSSSCFIFILLFFPETLRLVVGNGSIPAPWYGRPLVPLIGPYRRSRRTSTQPPAVHHPASRRKRTNPFVYFREPDVVFMLLSSGLVYALFVTVQATTSALLQSAYPFLTQTDVGLCFLPMGISSMLASFFTGRFLDWQYRRDRAKWTTERKRIRREQGGDKVDVDAPWTKEEELTFHIELARVKWGMAYTLVAVASAFGYGWALDKRVHLSVPMILQFLNTYATVGQMNCFQTLLLDAFPGSGSSMTAINNFVRCLLGAGITSIINIINDAIGTGWTYMLVGGICGVFSPLSTLVVIRMGPKWRSARASRQEQRSLRRSEKAPA